MKNDVLVDQQRNVCDQSRSSRTFVRGGSRKEAHIPTAPGWDDANHPSLQVTLAAWFEFLSIHLSQTSKTPYEEEQSVEGGRNLEHCPLAAGKGASWEQLAALQSAHSETSS